jgi:CheY-like chemotaxis protein
VLVVDDEPMIRQLLEDCLADAGYVIQSAVNGADALRQVERKPPDLVVLDLMMPVMDAEAFIKQLRRKRDNAHLPIVVVSAAYDACEVAARLGAQACFSKPFELDDLVGAVNNLIGPAVAEMPRMPEHVRTAARGRSF